MELNPSPEPLLEWLDRGWNGKTDPVDPAIEEMLECRSFMLLWLAENYPRYRAQQKKCVPGQGKLFS